MTGGTRTFYEFFCGAGMARAGLGRQLALPHGERQRRYQSRVLCREFWRTIISGSATLPS